MNDLLNWEKTINKHLNFTTNTFPKSTSIGALGHAKKEVDEAISDIKSGAPIIDLATEYADILGCVFDSANRNGILPKLILMRLDAKIDINISREWKDNGDGSYSHIKK